MKKLIQTALLIFPTLIFGQVTPMLSGVSYKYYQKASCVDGTWDILPNFDALIPTKTGHVSSFDISPRIQNDCYAFEFTSIIKIVTSGNYTFYANSDDGSQIFINGSIIVNNDGLHGMVELNGLVNLPIGYHKIKVTFFERAGGDNLIVSYAGPGIIKQVIPTSVLYNTITDGMFNYSQGVLEIDPNLSVGIGTTTPDAKLTVKGNIHAEEVTVDLSVPGPDYVFDEDYDLPTLSETEDYIKANKHLPEIQRLMGMLFKVPEFGLHFFKLFMVWKNSPIIKLLPGKGAVSYRRKAIKRKIIRRSS